MDDFHYQPARDLGLPPAQRWRSVQRENGLFEAVLLPQMYNARRFAFDFAEFPHMRRIEAACLALPAFVKAHPDNQPDTPEGP